MSNEELDLLNEMKENCLKKGQYIDKKAKDKFNMLCHCEDFIIENYEQSKEIERLNNIINNGKNKVQEVKEHLDKSGFDGMTKSILIMALNEIIYSLNGDGSNE